MFDKREFTEAVVTGVWVVGAPKPNKSHTHAKSPGMPPNKCALGCKVVSTTGALVPRQRLFTEKCNKLILFTQHYRHTSACARCCVVC